MNKFYACIVTAGLLTLPFAASAEYDGSSVFTCASIEVMECLPMQGCNEVSADAVDIPRFLKVDVTNKQITTGVAEDQLKTTIERVEEVKGKMMLQGAEHGKHRDSDGVGWSMAVNKENGDMVLSASGDGVAFVVFGACTTL